MIIAIDFDGVIHDKLRPVEGRKMGRPIDGAQASVTRLKDDGNMIIIHTVMAASVRGIQAVADWMKYYSIPYDLIMFTKPNADVFIDDKAIRFESWSDTLNKLGELHV